MIINGNMIYDEASAIEFLKALGMDKFDIEDFVNLICAERIEEAEYKMEVAKQEQHASECYEEELRNVICEVSNIVDEALEMERISKPRERFEAIARLVDKI